MAPCIAGARHPACAQLRTAASAFRSQNAPSPAGTLIALVLTMNHRNSSFLALPLVALAACSGGGGGANAGNPGNNTGTAVHVVLDTAGGSPALVQAQIVGATFERSDGSQTGNVLDAPRNVTLNDPGGEAEAFELRHVAAGGYVALHLAIAPGTGSAQFEDGSRAGVDLPSSDLRIAFEDGFAHGSAGDSWLGVRHVTAAALAGSGGRRSWSPDLAGGGAADDSLGGVTLRLESHDPNGFASHLAGDDHGLVHVEFENESELFDDHGGRHGDHGAWLAGVGPGDDVWVSGTIDQSGTVRGRRARHHGNRPVPRLLGRITSLDGVAHTFEMDVLATVLHGDRSLLPVVDHVVVAAGAAEIHFSRTQTQLTFADLQPGARVKVEIASRTGSNVTAREIEVASRDGAPQFPEIEGMVSAVDTVAGTITVVRRHNDPLLLNGQPVNSIAVRVLPHTFLFRKERSGGGRTVIGLADVVPAQDRIWVRGTATGSNSVDADWVRVRAE